MSRRPLVYVAILVVLSIAVALLPSNRPGKTPVGAPPWGFAGYLYSGVVTQIGGQWRVPDIATTSATGSASTWIGAQSGDGHFIQLGTTENSIDHIRLYQVFWSDPVVGFHPQVIATVASGDRISFTMNQTVTGWRLKFDDSTRQRGGHLLVPYGRGVQFNLGEWTQEDPTVGSQFEHLPYPTMSLVSFHHLALNGRAPPLQQEDGQAMATANGVYLVPTSVRNRGFTFVHASGAALQYLRDEYGFHAAFFDFEVRAGNDVVTPVYEVKGILADIGPLERSLDSQRWPRRVRHDIKSEVLYLKQLHRLLQTWPVHRGSQLQSDIAQYTVLESQDGSTSAQLCYRLGLPQAFQLD